MGKFEETSRYILEHVGGAGNITNVTHCATRLRIEVAKKRVLDMEALKTIPEAAGIVDKGRQIQVIIGPKVNDAYNEFLAVSGWKPGMNADAEVEDLTANQPHNAKWVMDKVAGLDGGADDYMTKPFAIEELLARIRLVLKKRGGAVSEDKSHLGIGKLHMDVQRYEVSYDGQQIELTHREFELLRVLLENKNIVISRDTLLEKVCGYDYMGETNIIDVYVRYLRSKIDDVYQVKIIQTVRGVGYCIKEE